VPCPRPCVGMIATMGKLTTVGLVAAIFSLWMNISSSILANYWRKRRGLEEKMNGERLGCLSCVTRISTRAFVRL
jgi:hypothetical protein